MRLPASQADGKAGTSGRIVDGERSRLRTALREIVARFGCDPILMPSQDIILSEVRPQDRDGVTALLREHGVPLAVGLRDVFRRARPDRWPGSKDYDDSDGDGAPPRETVPQPAR